MLPADESAEPSDRRVEDVERGAVSLPPDDPLGVRRDELPMGPEELPLVRDEKKRVVDGPHRKLGVLLVDPDDDMNACLARCAAEDIRCRARDLYRISLQPGER